MSELEADVLIVGARCAGSVLALHLRKQGKRVIVVDSCSMPSDQPISTHFIGCYGMRELDLLGLGDKVRAIAPPVPAFINAIDGKPIVLPFPPQGRGSCIRRSDLDPMLVEAAREAGADVRLRSKVIEVIKDSESRRVIGAVVQDMETKTTTTIRAPLVVGADGRHSFVATAVGAEEYDAYDCERSFYWAYFKRPNDYSTNPNYQGAAAITWLKDDVYFIFPTNTDQLLIGCGFPKTQLADWRGGKHKEKLIERLRANDFTAHLIKDQAGPVEEPRGVIDMRFYFRQAAGPGWALVGDAGLHKDPSPGLGMSDAFRDAHALADAIEEGTDEALIAYWRQRDVASHELFHFAKDLGDVAYNSVLTRLLFRKIGQYEWTRENVVKMHMRTIEPSAAFPLKHILKWTIEGLLRGQLALLRPFLRAGKRGAEVQKAKKLRVHLAEEATARAKAARERRRTNQQAESAQSHSVISKASSPLTSLTGASPTSFVDPL